MKSCHGCPINITTEEGDVISSYGCLPAYADAIKWYKETGKVWACHEKPETPCKGFLIRAKYYNEKVSVNKDTILITEETTLEEIYS